MEITKPTIENKVWGFEEKIVNLEGKYCGKKLYLNKGFRSSIHAHQKEETFYIESGRIYFEKENENHEMESAILSRNDIVHIAPNHYHRFSGIISSVIIEFSTPDCESLRMTQSEKIPNYEEWIRKVEAIK